MFVDSDGNWTTVTALPSMDARGGEEKEGGAAAANAGRDSDIPQLPPSSASLAQQQQQQQQQQVEVGGGPVTLDSLGPVVVNTDGSISRINNWSSMSEIEKQATKRIIGKRNEERRAALLSK